MPLWKEPKNGRWRYQFQHLGQRYSKTGFDTRRRPMRKAEHRAELEQRANRLSQRLVRLGLRDPDPGGVDGAISSVAERKLAPIP